MSYLSVIKWLRQTFLIMALGILISCGGSGNEQEASFTVVYKGALKNIMQKADLSAQANLRDYAEVEHLYGLGAVKDLKGEILILDGKPYISKVQDVQLIIDQSFDHEATLFVYASVSEWKSIKVPEHVSSYEELEDFVASSANAEGIDMEKPFPFMLQGSPKYIDWHVIEWPENDKKHTHEKHKTAGPHGRLMQNEMEILGFYSNSHHGQFTHHSTNMHMHFKAADNSLAGHVDGIELEGGIKLLLPEGSN